MNRFEALHVFGKWQIIEIVECAHGLLDPGPGVGALRIPLRHIRSLAGTRPDHGICLFMHSSTLTDPLIQLLSTPRGTAQVVQCHPEALRRGRVQRARQRPGHRPR